MGIKQHILETLNLTLEDLDEEELLTLVMSAYKKQQTLIQSLRDRIEILLRDVRQGEEQMQEIHRRIRTDPLYCVAEGVYWFQIEERKICLRIHGGKFEVFERRTLFDSRTANSIDVMGRLIPTPMD